MTATQFAEFWRAQGYRVVETASCFWYNAHPFAFLSMPYHRIVTPSVGELARVFLGGPSILVRYPGGADREGRESWLFACADRDYDFGSLQPRARTMTRRGLETCDVEQVDFGYLARRGHALNLDTFCRQGRDRHSMSETQWRKYCGAATKSPSFEAWAALNQGQLAAFMVTALVEDCFSILHHSSATAHLGRNPNNALVFAVTKRALSRADVAWVSYGLNGLDGTRGLEQFKFRMGFGKKHFRERVVFNPAVKPFLSLGGRKIIRAMARKHPESDLWRKASAVLQHGEAAFDAQ
jgi:hypothetical protein